MEQSAAELIKINIDQGCDYNCEICSRYFQCLDPAKEFLYNRGRMDIAAKRMARIKRKILVLGGKGGVGKTTVAVNLSTALASHRFSVCCLDADFDSPSVPTMLGVKGRKMLVGSNGLTPVESHWGVRVMSTGFFVQDAEVVTWLADMRRSATEEFCTNTDYGDLDYLVVDLPPGTGADSVNMMQYISGTVASLIVTIPSDVSQNTARRAAILCRQAGVPILGIVENMSGYNCPSCHQNVHVLRFGGGERLAEELGIPFLGRFPLYDIVSMGADEGVPFVAKDPESPATQTFMEIVNEIERRLDVLEKEGRTFIPWEDEISFEAPRALNEGVTNEDVQVEPVELVRMKVDHGYGSIWDRDLGIRKQAAAKKMANIRHKLLVMGGKGGVGKTVVAVNLAAALAMQGSTVCCLDADLDCPSVPKMLSASGARMMVGPRGMIPVETPHDARLRVMSTDYFVEAAEAITWFSDMRRGAVEEFCANTDYGDLDYLVVDLPPGTSDESINMMQYIDGITGAVIVTIAAEVAQNTARRVVTLCQQAGVPILGIIENMSGYHCPNCDVEINVMRRGGGQSLARELGIPFLGALPLADIVSEGSDEGIPFVTRDSEAPAVQAFLTIVEKIKQRIEELTRTDALILTPSKKGG